MLPQHADTYRDLARWVIRTDVRPDARMRLICVPHAGAPASVYRDWPALVGADVEVLSIQLPGRAARMTEAPLTSLALVVDRLHEALEPWLDRPYALFGHSMGALIVYELARSLEASGWPAPAHLFVSAQAAPHRPHRLKSLHRLNDDDLLAELRSLTGTPDPAMENAELMQLLMPTLRADCAMCAAYQWTSGPRLTCPVTACGGRDDVLVTELDLDAWQRHTAGRFDLRMFAGDHFYLQAQARPALMRAIGARLRRAAAVGRRPAAELDAIGR